MRVCLFIQFEYSIKIEGEDDEETKDKRMTRRDMLFSLSSVDRHIKINLPSKHFEFHYHDKDQLA